MAAAAIRTATKTETGITKDKVKDRAKTRASVRLKALKDSARTTRTRARATDKIIIIKVNALLSLPKGNALSSRKSPILSTRKKRRRRPSRPSPLMMVAGVPPCSPPNRTRVGLTQSLRAQRLSLPAQPSLPTLTVVAQLPGAVKAVEAEEVVVAVLSLRVLVLAHLRSL